MAVGSPTPFEAESGGAGLLRSFFGGGEFATGPGCWREGMDLGGFGVGRLWSSLDVAGMTGYWNRVSDEDEEGLGDRLVLRLGGFWVLDGMFGGRRDAGGLVGFKGLLGVDV